jgi:hypothetical protein
MSHAGQTVTIDAGDTSPRIVGSRGEPITTVPRASGSELSRFKGCGTRRQP